MTIKELITQLMEYPPDLKVVLSKDAEGNGFSPVYEAEPALYVPDSTWSGEVYNSDDPDILEDPNAEQVLVFWPVN